MAARSIVRIAVETSGIGLGLSAVLLGQRSVFGEIAEAREHAFEVELPRADRAVTLLGDDDVGFVVDLFAALHPAVPALVELAVILVRPLIGLGPLVIILLPVDE